MINYDFPQEFLNKINDAIAQKSDLERSRAFLAIMNDPATTTSQKLYIRSLLNSSYGAFKAPDYIKTYDPKMVEEITKKGQETIEELKKDPSIMESFFDIEKMYPGVVSNALLDPNDEAAQANDRYWKAREENRYLRILNAEQIHIIEKRKRPGFLYDPEDVMMLKYHERMKEFLDQERADNDY